jgi:apolipoprotein N-acyltransferase
VASLGAAGLLWASFFPGWGWLAWLALVPFLWSLDGASLRRGVVLGTVFGLAFFLLQFASLFSLWPLVGAVTILAWIALSIFGALFWAVFGAVAGWRAHPFLWAGAWTLLEVTRAAGPLGFTFGSVPASMAESPFLPAAALGGPWLLSLGVAWTAGCLARGLRRPRWLAGAILGPLFLVGLAQLPDGTREAGEIRIALVQPNISKAEQLDPSGLPDQVALYREMLAGITAPVDLIALPENALPWGRENREYLALLQTAGARVGAQVLVGTGEFRDGKVYNTTLVLSPAGEIVGSYAKTHLVPFGERVPWREFWTRIGFGPLIDPFLPFDLTPGETAQPVGNLGIMICFESTFPGISRELARHGAEVLITPTNDAWFGRTRILWEHYALGSLRAVETGRSFIQVGQTGFSGGWDHRGRELGRFPPWTRGVLVLDVPLRSGQTPYVRLGDGPVLGIAGLLVVLGLMTKRPRAGGAAEGRLRR